MQARSLKVLTESNWDGGIITEGVKPDTGQPDQAGSAFEPPPAMSGTRSGGSSAPIAKKGK
jgi:hypothetical protein